MNIAIMRSEGCATSIQARRLFKRGNITRGLFPKIESFANIRWRGGKAKEICSENGGLFLPPTNIASALLGGGRCARRAGIQSDT
jgi:hypothetical protein